MQRTRARNLCEQDGLRVVGWEMNKRSAACQAVPGPLQERHTRYHDMSICTNKSMIEYVKGGSVQSESNVV